MWDQTEQEVDAQRRDQIAYLARYAPGFHVRDDMALHELGAFVAAVSAIVQQENKKGEA